MADDVGAMKPAALPAVYTAIASVMRDVGVEGIAKARKNLQQGYQFRGIDDVYNTLAPILARHQLIIVPRVLSRVVTERETAKGGVMFCVVVQVEFDIVCSVDGSRITASTYGEASDSADKATNKAMSAAYKYMAMQTFCIPTEGDNDADLHHVEVAARTNAGAAISRQAQQATGAGASSPPAPVQTASKADARGDFAAMQSEIRACQSEADLKAWGAANVTRVKAQPKDWQAEIRTAYADRLDELRYMADAQSDAARVYDGA